MNYTRPSDRRKVAVEFPVGNNHAVILDAKLNVSKNTGANMISLKLAGKLNEIGYYHLVFGNTMTAVNLTFLLASIEDNGVNIPDMDFAYNQSTVDFLKGKPVYIKVIKERYKGGDHSKIAEFMTSEEFGVEQHADSQPDVSLEEAEDLSF